MKVKGAICYYYTCWPGITVLATALGFFRRLVVVVDDCYACTGPIAPYLVSARGSKGGA